ncbi:hypothetical protein BLNAU_13867 [Blattamonas nauphoetae]|uniref:Uncharacterized protein n=1 Tax=Blattamonas nauphoetae TaxID=2049346 RepID=A0ABQ9XLX0_9EUKA|nr:hypothetical protein BLNAU_13867 [Blattamonas nauphoetae]
MKSKHGVPLHSDHRSRSWCNQDITAHLSFVTRDARSCPNTKSHFPLPEQVHDDANVSHVSSYEPAPSEDRSTKIAPPFCSEEDDTNLEERMASQVEQKTWLECRSHFQQERH